MSDDILELYESVIKEIEKANRKLDLHQYHEP